MSTQSRLEAMSTTRGRCRAVLRTNGEDWRQLRRLLTRAHPALLLVLLVLLAWCAGEANARIPVSEPQSYLHIDRTVERPQEIERGRGEGARAYMARVVDAVHQGTFHCNGLPGAEPGPGSPPRGPTAVWGIMTARHTACGLCGQRSYWVVKALQRGGIRSARVLVINGHGVAVASVGGRRYFLDADYGVGPAPFPRGADHAAHRRLLALFERRLTRSRERCATCAGIPRPVEITRHLPTIRMALSTTEDDVQWWNVRSLSQLARLQEELLASLDRLQARGQIDEPGLAGALRRAKVLNQPRPRAARTRRIPERLVLRDHRALADLLFRLDRLPAEYGWQLTRMGKNSIDTLVRSELLGLGSAGSTPARGN